MFNAVAPPAGTLAVGELTHVDFTSPVAGTALLRGRGWCNILGGVNANGINIIGGTGAAANLFNGQGFQEMGITRTVAGAPAQVHQLAFSTENAVAVQANVATTATLAIRRETGTDGVNCSGSFTVQIFGALP